MERAFVVQFDPVDNTRARLRGRVELVASGEATRLLASSNRSPTRVRAHRHCWCPAQPDAYFSIPQV